MAVFVSSKQEFGFRGSPAALVQVPTPSAAQSASFRHPICEFPAHDPQAHFLPVAPLQFGLCSVSAMVLLPLLVLSPLIDRVAMRPAADGGQSRLVVPKAGIDVVPFPSHASP